MVRLRPTKGVKLAAQAFGGSVMFVIVHAGRRSLRAIR